MADWYKASLSVNQTKDAAEDFPFNSRRSAVLSKHASVASSQPLATETGIRILRQGGNAADAAIAVAAVLAVTEPCSTGLGGDMFCLYYDTQKVHCVNGSGRSPQGLTLDLLKERYPKGDEVDTERFRDSPHSVTVPGAAQGWEDFCKRHGSGKFSFAQLLEPAAELADEGFPVGPVTAHHWRAGVTTITRWQDGDTPLSKNGGPQTGEIVRNPHMARVLRDLGRDGAQAGFYRGETGQAIVHAVQKHGGCLSMDDLKSHSSTFPEAISVEYRGHLLWQHPPNGQGLAGLVALSSLQHLEKTGVLQTQPGSADTFHALIEMMRLGFADARAFVTDPGFMQTSVETILDEHRIQGRVDRLFDPLQATIAGLPDASSGTVSFQVVDDQGHAVSFVNSNFMGFGTGIVPQDCGFCLQNRGFGFSLEADHDNVVAPAKRPYHTIIPAILTHADTNELYATLSNMGGNMQPQGHLQLTVNMLAGDMDPQQAIDMPRFCIADGSQDGVCYLEAGVDDQVVANLQLRGHSLRPNERGRSLFGKAQIIKRDRNTGVLWAGSDGRGDGCAMGF